MQVFGLSRLARESDTQKKKVQNRKEKRNGKTIYDIDHSVVLGWKKDGTVILIHCDKKGNIITISETRPEAGKESQWREEEVTLNSDVFQD